MDNIQRFSGRATDYLIGRPSYAAEFIDYLYSEQGLSEQSVIADVGSGTGKFAKQLLNKGSCVYCVEPNADMRNAAINELSTYEKFNVVDGTSTETTLNAATVDFVTAAQAFHWFDADLFYKECKRILKHDGKIILIWNMRDMADGVNKATCEIYQKFCSEFKGFNGGMKKDDERIKQFFRNGYKCVEFDNALFYDKKQFISRSLSSSYSLKSGDDNYDVYISELSEVFDTYSSDGVLKVANQTVAYIGGVN